MSAVVESITPARLMSPAVDDSATQEALLQFLSGLAERSQCFASESTAVDGVPAWSTDSNEAITSTVSPTDENRDGEHAAVSELELVHDIAMAEADAEKAEDGSKIVSQGPPSITVSGFDMEQVVRSNAHNLRILRVVKADASSAERYLEASRATLSLRPLSMMPPAGLRDDPMKGIIVSDVNSDGLDVINWLTSVNRIGLLPVMQVIVLEGPNNTHKKTTSDDIAAAIALLAQGRPLLLPELKTMFFKDLFHSGVTAPMLSELVIWFDLSSLPVVPRPTLEELLRVIRICRDSLRVLGVKDAIDAKTAFIDYDDLPDIVDFSSLSALHVAGATDNAQVLIEQLRWSRTAGVTTDVYIADTDPSSKPYRDLRMIFKALLRREAATEGRNLHILRDALENGTAVTRFNWLPEPICGQQVPLDGSTLVRIHSPDSDKFCWGRMAKTFAEAFKETERLSQHPPLRSLALLVDGAGRIVTYALAHPDVIPEPAYHDLLHRLLYIQELERPAYPASYTCN